MSKLINCLYLSTSESAIISEITVFVCWTTSLKKALFILSINLQKTQSTKSSEGKAQDCGV